MAEEFKVGYKTRNKLQRAIQRVIRDEGLVQEETLLNSVRISSTTGDLNQLYITINAVYYYMFLDEGAELWNGGFIKPYDITEQALSSSLGRQFQQECVDAYVAWMLDNYPILDVGRIAVDKLSINIKYNLFGDPDGAWNGEYYKASNIRVNWN
jgi:hypothetical protein